MGSGKAEIKLRKYQVGIMKHQAMEYLWMFLLLFLIASCPVAQAYDSTDPAQRQAATEAVYRQAVINDPDANRGSATLDYINHPDNIYAQKVIQQINEGDYEGAKQTEIFNYINGDK